MNNWSEFSFEAYDRTDVPKDIFLVRGMLSRGEIKALYTAARDFFTGTGAIIDAGAFAGLSAHCFAFGVSDNMCIDTRRDRVFSYDDFIPENKFIRKYIEYVFYSHRPKNMNSMRLDHEMQPGESFRNIFEHQNHRFKDVINIFEGDFLKFDWDQTPVEILFADICKTKPLQDHLYKSFMQNMIPGGSILIHQDYNHPAHPWIQLSMEILRPYFEIRVFSEGGSKIYFLKDELPLGSIQEAIDLKLDELQVREAYNRIVSETAENHKGTLRVAEVNALRFLGLEEAANKRRSEVSEILRASDIERWKHIL